MVERIERRRQAAPDRGRARSRQLLAADDRSKPGKAGLALADRGHAGQLEDRLQPAVLLHQRFDRLFEIGLGVEVDEHFGGLQLVMRGLTRAFIYYRNRVLKDGLPGQVRQ